MQVKPSYDPVGSAVPEATLDIDDDQEYWLGSEKFTGFLGETLPSGNYEFASYRDGVLDGPSGELSPDGDLVLEEWYRRNFLHGITRTFRHDGTLATAVGYEYAYKLWTVRFDFDGRTVLATEGSQLSEPMRQTLEVLRARVAIGPVLGPEFAADFNRH